jgi:hypothetical protein
MATPAEMPSAPTRPDARVTAYRSACTAIERASLARRQVAVTGQLRSIAALEQLELTDEEIAWLRDHPGDLLSPGRPSALKIGTREKKGKESGPGMICIIPAPATS